MIIQPEWPAAPHVRCLTTTRKIPGNSQGVYADFNLALHVDDNPETVASNRTYLEKYYHLPASPHWLAQVHGTTVLNLDEPYTNNQADAAFTTQANTVCSIMTADCLPILLVDQQGSKIAAIHAGWRSLAAGIIENTVAQLNIPGEQLIAWLGPGISAEHYEVGDDVRDAFIANDPSAAQAFSANHRQRWLADMYMLARQRLQQLAIQAIYGGNYCTYQQADLFYSYRRDGITGRMATLIWLDKAY